MSRRIDLTGNKYNMLTVIEFAEKRGNESYWLCRCDCGNEKIACGSKLKSGNTKSCGCLRIIDTKKRIRARAKEENRISLVGKRFGNLAVIKNKYPDVISKQWICQCDCGKIIELSENDLLKNGYKSCGCKKIENAKKSNNRDDELSINKKNKKIIGVSYDKKTSKWQAYIGFKKKLYYLGHYVDKEDAIKIRRKAEDKLNCDFIKWYEEEYKKNIQNEKKNKDNAIIGNRYGRLVVLKDTGKRKNSYKIWLCQCDCGNLCEATISSLKDGHVRSCGCIRKDKAYDILRFKDISGKKFGKLLAIKRIDTKNGSALWYCKCDCGNYKEVRYSNLVSGNTVSCDCHKKEQASKLFSENPKIVNYRNETFVDGTKVDLINNDKVNKNNTTGYKGVTKIKKSGKYSAYISFKNKTYRLGTYDDVISAAEARKAAENELYSDFLEWYAKEYPERWAKMNKTK